MLTSERLPFALPFPRISPDGRYLAGGQRTCRVYRVGQWDRPIYEDKAGALPGWFTPDTIAYLRGREVWTRDVYRDCSDRIAINLPGTNYFTVAPGAWAVHHKKQIIVNGVVRATDALPHFAIHCDWLAYQDTALVVHVLRGKDEVGRYANLGGECHGGITIDADGPVMARVKGKTWELWSGDAIDISPPVPESCPLWLVVEKMVSVAPDGRMLIREAFADSAVIVAPAGDQSFDAVLLDDGSIATVSQHPDVGVRWCVVPPDAVEEPIVPPAPTPDVAPFAHHFYCAAYKDAGNDAPRNVALCVDGGNPIPPTGPVIVDADRLFELHPSRDSGDVVGLYVESVGADGNLAIVEAKARSVREQWTHYSNKPIPPVIAYVGAAVPDKPIPGVDVVLLEGRYKSGSNPVMALSNKAIDATDRGLRFGFVCEATDGYGNGNAGALAEDGTIAEWMAGFSTLIRKYQPPFAFVWAWSRYEPKDGTEHGLKAHPQTQAWVRAIVAAIPPQEAPMIWTDAMRDLLVQFAAKVGGWNGTTWTDPANAPVNGDDSARAWTKKCAEQFAWRNSMWGCKAQTPDHPQSTDGLAYSGPEPWLWVFDVLANSGAANCTLNDRPTAVDATGQEFRPVTPHDYIGETPEPPPPPDVEARLDALERQVAKLNRFAKQVWPKQF